MKLWPWKKTVSEDCSLDSASCQVSPSQEALQAVADSELLRETAEYRWPRVDAAVARAVESEKRVRSQRDQNHLGEIVYRSLHVRHGGTTA